MYKTPIVLAIVGFLILAIAVALPLVFPLLFEKTITQKLILSKDSEIFENFKKPPVSTIFEVWMFNLTNANDVLQGAKPILNQVGPYTYRIEREKVDINFNHTIGTIKSKTRSFYYFEPKLSGGNESDIITTINLVFTSIASMAENPTISPVIKAIAEVLFLRFDQTPFMTHTVGEMLFHGFDVPLLKQLYPLTNKERHRRGKSGFYYMKNGSVSTETEVFTGELGMENYQHIYKFDGQNKLSRWSEDRCNMLNGTLGSQFTRPLNASQNLSIFSSALCRSVYASYEKDLMIGPLKLHRYIIPSEILKKTPENECFCITEFTCRSSMIDVSPCKRGTPIIISTAHFLGGDLRDIQAVEGISPNKEEHEIYLDIEPTIGVTMRAAKRIQINMPLKRYAGFPSLANVPELILPVFWFNESASVPMERAYSLYITLEVPALVVKYGSLVLLIISIILIIMAIIFAYKVHKKNKYLYKRRQQLRDRIFDTTESSLLRYNKPRR